MLQNGIRKKERFERTLPPLNYPDFYNFLLELPQEKYPWFLKLLFWKNKRYKLDLNNPVTFCEKIQWLKLFGATPLKRDLTDKILVRNFVSKKIGEQYLKRIFQIQEHFCMLDFNNLPDDFVIKCNHGCKWQFFIKDKNAFISNERLKKLIGVKLEKMLSLQFFAVGGLELQYKGIKPLIFIEEFLKSDTSYLTEFQIWCFNGKAKIIEKVIFTNPARRSVWDENFQTSLINFDSKPSIVEAPSNEIKEAVRLSETLADGFSFVRVDWIFDNRKLYFNEMTFTPYSGFVPLTRDNDLILGTYLDLKKGQ